MNNIYPRLRCWTSSQVEEHMLRWDARQRAEIRTHGRRLTLALLVIVGLTAALCYAVYMLINTPMWVA